MKIFNKISFKFPYLRKGSYLLYLFCTIFFVYFVNYNLDNDTWFLLNHGRYIYEFGIPYIEPFTIHENLNFVMQQWLSSLIFYIFYNFFGIKSLLFLLIIINFLIVFLSYKLCMLISNNNYKISVIITIVMDILLSTFFVVSRPQIFTFILILLLLYCMEFYVKTGKIKYLFILPIISLLQINLHASMWLMFFVIMVPYLFDGYKFKHYNHDVYKKYPILFVMGLMFLVGFINPYGIDSITYLFNSYGVDAINNFVYEMKPLNVNDLFGKIAFFCTFIVGIGNIFVGKKEIKIRYFLLFIGTTYLTLSSIKGFSYFILVSFFPFAYYLKDKIIIKKEVYGNFYKLSCLVGIITIFVIFGVFYYNKGVNYVNKLEAGINLLLEKYNSDEITLYVGYNNGGYTEFMGIRSYIDPRAEVFLKENNGKNDIFGEYYDLLSGYIEFDDFVEKYNFSHLLVSESEIFYDDVENFENYSLFYEGEISKDERYRIYVRNDFL